MEQGSKSRALVLVSGGMASAVLATELRTSHEVTALHIAGNQAHRDRRLSAVRDLAHALRIGLICLDLSALYAHLGAGASALLAAPGARPHAEEIAHLAGRNLMLLSVAASLAEAGGMHAVGIGAHSGQVMFAGSRPQFLMDAAAAVRSSTLARVMVIAPLQRLGRREIAERGQRCGAPLALTWSCREGGVVHCGRCYGCVERAEAIARAGIADMTIYRDPAHWRTAVPGPPPAPQALGGNSVPPVECPPDRACGGAPAVVGDGRTALPVVPDPQKCCGGGACGERAGG